MAAPVAMQGPMPMMAKKGGKKMKRSMKRKGRK